MLSHRIPVGKTHRLGKKKVSRTGPDVSTGGASHQGEETEDLSPGQVLGGRTWTSFPPHTVDWILYLPLATIIAIVCLLGAFPGGDASWGKSLCPTGQFPEHLHEAARGVFSPYDTLHVTSLLLPCSKARSLV